MASGQMMPPEALGGYPPAAVPTGGDQPRSAGVYDNPTMIPSGESIRATVWPQGSVRATCRSAWPAAVLLPPT
jgi:hypothetical protein